MGSPRTTEHVPGRDQQAPYRSSSKGLRRRIRDVNIWFCIIFDVENDSVSFGTVRLGRSKTRMRFLFKVSYCSVCFYYPIFIFCFTAINDKSLTCFLSKNTKIFKCSNTILLLYDQCFIRYHKIWFFIFSKFRTFSIRISFHHILRYNHQKDIMNTLFFMKIYLSIIYTN